MSEKFIKEIKEEAINLKENTGIGKVDKDQLLKDMYNFMLKAAEALEELGLQRMKKQSQMQMTKLLQLQLMG